MKQYDAWPHLPYKEFQSTSHLLHMLSQMIGKLKLSTPFEPHWANVGLWITSCGVTSGPIPFNNGVFEIEIDLILHVVKLKNSWSQEQSFKLNSMSVSELMTKLFDHLKLISVNLSINTLPQEISNPIHFEKDNTVQPYSAELANAWLRSLISSYRVMQRYHAKFLGTSPQIALMWGTFDLRDARYINKRVPTTGDNAGYIRRNAMDMAQVEVGWWSGNEQYPKPAYFSFLYPQPPGIEQVKPQPTAARWDKTLGEFILDYDDLIKSTHPEEDLLAFFESTYQALAEKAGWEKTLIGSGEPV